MTLGRNFQKLKEKGELKSKKRENYFGMTRSAYVIEMSLDDYLINEGLVNWIYFYLWGST